MRTNWKKMYNDSLKRQGDLLSRISSLALLVETGQYPGAEFASQLREIEQLRELVNDLLEKNKKLEVALLLAGRRGSHE